jgi:hypothetical protein
MTGRIAMGAVLLAATLAGCGGGPDHPADGDTGAASPAATPTPNAPGSPDSTTGMSQRTGSPGAAGTRQSQSGDSGLRSSSPASSAPKPP